MSIIDYTERLRLTQYTGNSIMPQFMRNYNSDMAKIDAYFESYEAGINQTISEMQTSIDEFEQRIDADFETLSTEVGTYSDRITTLESCCSDVNTVLSNYGSRLNAIELVIDTVSTQNIDDIIARVDALENKVNTNSTEIGTLQHDLGEAVERIGELEHTVVLHATDITNLGNRVTTLENCCEEVRDTLAEYNTRIAANASDIDALEDRLTRDETNIAGNAADIVILSQQTAVNTQDIQDLKDAFDTLDPQSALSVVRQVAINTENISNLQSAVSANSTSISNLTTRITNNESTISSQDTRIATLEDEFEQISDWQNAIDAATAAAQQATSDVAAMQADVTAIEGDITSIKGDITALQAADTALVTRVTTLEEKEATVESNLSALNARVTANEGSITNIENTIHDDEAGLANAVSRIGALETQNGSVDISAVGNSVTDAVDKVNTKAVNANSMANQALTTANAVATTIGDANNGLVKDVADNTSNISALENTVGDANNGLVKDVADLNSDVDDMTWVTLGTITEGGQGTYGNLANNLYNIIANNVTTWKDYEFRVVVEVPATQMIQIYHYQNCDQANQYINFAYAPDAGSNGILLYSLSLQNGTSYFHRFEMRGDANGVTTSYHDYINQAVGSTSQSKWNIQARKLKL